MKQACKYNIIRFEPYAETQEFANIGIILFAPKSRTFIFKLLAVGTHGRITHFFDKMDKSIFQDTVRLVNNELERIKKMMPDFTSPESLYDELVRPREGIINYSAHYVRMSDDPVKTLDDLFEYYVNHGFTKDQGHEERMRRNIESLLNQHNLTKHFKDRHIGHGHYEVRLPFVNKEPVPAVIKPIHFQHPNSKKLMDHGFQWLTTMKQLYRMNSAHPDLTMFTYKAPIEKTGLLRDAFDDICGQIRDEGIMLSDINDLSSITNFATKHATQYKH